MKYFVDILKQFSQTQRLLVLLLLLSFTTGGILISQYLKTDDCRPIIEENLKMHQDFVKISEMLRNEILKKDEVILDTLREDSTPKHNEFPIEDELMSQILKIAESNKK